MQLNRENTGSLRRRLELGFLWTMFVLAVVILSFVLYTVSVYKRNQMEFNQNVTENYARFMETDIRTLMNFVRSTASDNVYYRRLTAPGLSDFDRMSAMYGLKNVFDSKMASIGCPAVLFYRDAAREDGVHVTFQDIYMQKTARRQQIYSLLAQHLENHEGSAGTEILSGKDSWLIYTYSYRNTYVGFVIDLSEYFSSYLAFSMENHALLAAGQNGEVFARCGEDLSPETLEQALAMENTGQNGYGTTVTRSAVGNYPLSMVLIGRSGRLLGLSKHPAFYLYLLGIPLTILGLFYGLSIYLKRIMLMPLDHLQKKVDQIRTDGVRSESRQADGSRGSEDTGDHPERTVQDPAVGIPSARYSGDIEFSAMNRSLDAIVEEINRLQRDKYAKELEVSQTQLQYLQLQVNPHFFLNCLNIISSLKRNRDEETERRFLSALVSHFRYVFNDKLSLVPLKSELKEVRDYVDLYTIRKGVPVLLKINSEEESEDCPVPVLVIQTFVENALKYASDGKSILSIEIQTYETRVEEVSYLCIQITDNGPGYTAENLRDFNTFGKIYEYRSEHVGIENLKYRLHIIYKDKAKIAFYNRREGGAAVDLYLPADTEELLGNQQEDRDEYSDHR